MMDSKRDRPRILWGIPYYLVRQEVPGHCRRFQIRHRVRITLCFRNPKRRYPNLPESGSGRRFNRWLVLLTKIRTSPNRYFPPGVDQGR